MTNRTEPLTTLDDVRAPHNIVAAVAGLREARTMIEALEHQGVEATHVSLLGAQKAGDASEVAEATTDAAESTVARGSAAGALTGAGAAGIAGAAIGLPGVGPLVAGGLWALFGGALGLSIGGVRSVGLSEAWLHTFDAVKAGNVAVGVHSDDPAEIDLAARVMGDLEPMSVNRFDD